MNRKIPYFSQNSNQPLGADFHLDEQMFLKWQNNGKSKTNLSSDRTYNRYVKTLLRVQNSIHRRFPPRRTKSSHDHRSRTSGGECSKGCGESEPKKSGCCQAEAKESPCETAKSDCCSKDKSAESCGHGKNKCSKKTKPEPTKSTCCDATDPNLRKCVTFEKPVAKEFPDCDPPFGGCPCLESTEYSSCPISDCCDEEPQVVVQRTSCKDPPKRKSSFSCCSCCKKRKSPSCPISDCCEEELQVEVQSTCGKEPPKRNSSFSCCSCCKRPKIVVPSDGGIRSESKLVHKDHSQSQHSKPNSKGKFKSNTKNCSADHQKSHANSSCNEVNKDQCHYFHLSEKPHCSSKPPPCGNCPDISDLSKQLCEMNKKLEGIQSQELGDIRHQVKCLTSNMESLAKKCVESKPPCPKLKRKASSTCQFCRGKSLPLLDSFLCQLNDAIGSLCKSDVLISVFLRADNVYHLNLRDLNSGKSLGCFLVSDCGIEEALKMGIFKDILTLSVIDVRNTIKPKNCPLGISFEFHYADRQSGGSDLKTRRNCRAGEECLACVLGIPLKSMKYVYSVPQVPEGSSGSSAPDQTLFRHQKFLSSDKVAILSDKLVLTDDDDNYVVDTLERPSLSDLEKNT